MFRIDRRLVKIAGTVTCKTDTDEKTEVGAEGENPDAATSKKGSGKEPGGGGAAAGGRGDAAAGERSGAAAGGRGDDELQYDEEEPDDDDDAVAAQQEDSEQSFDEPDDDDDDPLRYEKEVTALARQMADDFIAAAQRETEKRAQKIIDDARSRADGLLQDAGAEADGIRESARAQGYDEGKAEGYSEGKAEGEAEGRQIYEEKLAEQLGIHMAAVKNVLSELARERLRLEKEQEEDTTALAIEIVRKIIGPAEKELNNVFLSLIKNTIKQMTSDSKFIIRVSPKEYETYFSSGAAVIELDSGTVVTATVIRDARLDEGDLIIDADDVTVNAGIESQLNYVKLTFEEIGARGKEQGENGGEIV